MSLVTAHGATYPTGANNQLLFDGVFPYSYDAEGNRTARFIDVNANGLLDAGDHRFLPASLRLRGFALTFHPPAARDGRNA